MSPALNLDKRQRAMLREIGVQVWQPAAPEPAAVAMPPVRPVLKGPDSAALPAPHPVPVHVEVAIDSIAAGAGITSTKGTFRPQPAPVQPPAPPQLDARSDSSAVSWSAGQALALYAQAAPAPGPRWLVLAETPAAGSTFNPFEGEAGKLLDNMLRAVNLHKTGSVLLAPLVRRMGHEATADTGFQAALASLVQSVQPDVVLLMGRLAAQAVLQSSAPFGKLRGQVHTLHGSPTIVTHDAAYLLRSPLEKARAWEDLCLATTVLPTA